MTARLEFTAAEQAALTDGSGRALQLPAVAGSLRPKQIMFARLVAAGFSYTSSAKLAGYHYRSEASARNHGSELASDPRIAELIRVFTEALLKSTAPAALGVLTKVMQSSTAKDSDKVKAAKGLLDKVVPTLSRHESKGRIEVDHQHHFEPPARSLADLYREAGVPLPASLADTRTRPDVIDAEFEDVTAEDDVWSV